MPLKTVFFFEASKICLHTKNLLLKHYYRDGQQGEISEKTHASLRKKQAEYGFREYGFKHRTQ